MEKNYILKKFINKFFKVKSKWFKSKKILILLASSTLIISSAITTGTYFALHTEEKQLFKPKEILYYNLWGNNFKTYQNAIEYAKSQLKSDHYSYDAYRYQFEGKEFV